MLFMLTLACTQCLKGRVTWRSAIVPPACDLLHIEFLWKHLISLGQHYRKHVVSFQVLLPKKGHGDLELSCYMVLQ